MKLTLQHNDQILTLDVPFSVSEMKYADVIDFQAHEQDMFRYNQEEEPDSFIHALDSMNEAIGSLVDGDLSFLLSNIELESSQYLIDGGYTIAPGDELSTSRLYAHLVNTIEGYEPEQLTPPGKPGQPETAYSTKYKGDTYYIEPERANRLLDQKAYTNGETIELLEFTRQIQSVIEKKGDPQGNLAFTISMQQMAVLLRKEGETIPVKKGPRKEWIKKRAEHFAELPYDIVLNIRFFLIGTYVEYLKTQPMPSF